MGKQIAPSSFEELKTFEPINNSTPSSFEELKTFEEEKPVYVDSAPKGDPGLMLNGERVLQVVEMPPVEVSADALPSTKGTIKQERAAKADVARRNYVQNVAPKQARPVSEEDPKTAERRNFLRTFAETRGGNIPFFNPMEVLGMIEGPKAVGEGALKTLKHIGRYGADALTKGKDANESELIDAGISAAHGAFAGMMLTPSAQPFNVAFKVGEILLPKTTEALMKPSHATADWAIKTTFENETGRKITDKEFEDIKRNTEKTMNQPFLGPITRKQALEIGDIVGNFILFHQFHKGTEAVTGMIENRQREAFNADRVRENIAKEEQRKQQIDSEFEGYYSKVNEMRSGAVTPDSEIPILRKKDRNVPQSPIVDASGNPIDAEPVRTARAPLSSVEGENTPFIGNPNERLIMPDAPGTEKRQLLERNFENDSMVSRKLGLNEPLTLEEQLYADRYNIGQQKLLTSLSETTLPGNMKIEVGPQGADQVRRGKERTSRRPKENLSQVLNTQKDTSRLFYPDGKINVNKLAEVMLNAEKENTFNYTLSELQKEAKRRNISDAFVKAMQMAGEVNAGKNVKPEAPAPAGIPESTPERQTEPIAYNINDQRFNEIQKKISEGRQLNAKDIIEKQKFEERGVKFAEKPQAQKPKIAEKPVTANKETPKEEKKLSSTQVNIPDPKPFIDFAKSIPDEQVYKPETEGKPDGYGRELEPHVTALFGLKDNNPEQVRKVVKDFGDVEIELGKTSIFKGKDYDVLKVDVKSDALHAINKKLRDNVEYENDYPDYKPHLTIAYLKPGEGEQYVGDNRFEGKKITVSELLHSSADRVKTAIPLKEEKASVPPPPSFEEEVKNENSVSDREIKRWTDILDNDKKTGVDRLRSYLAGQVTGKEFGEKAEDFYARKGLTKFRDWAIDEAMKRELAQKEQSAKESSEKSNNTAENLFAEGRKIGLEKSAKDGTQQFHAFPYAIESVLNGRGIKGSNLRREIFDTFLHNRNYMGIESQHLKFDQVQNAFTLGLKADVEQLKSDRSYGDVSDVIRNRYEGTYLKDDSERLEKNLKNVEAKAKKVEDITDKLDRKVEMIKAITGETESTKLAEAESASLRNAAKEYVQGAKDRIKEVRAAEKQAEIDRKERIANNKTMLEGDLPDKLPKKDDLIPAGEVPKGEINVKPIPKSYRALPNDEAGVMKAMETVPTDPKAEPLRPMTHGILFDAEKQVAIATDGHQLVSLPVKVTETKYIRPDGEKVVSDGREYGPKDYVPYEKVIPDTMPNRKGIDLSGLISQLYGIYRATKFTENGGYAIQVRFKNENGVDGHEYIHAQAENMINSLEALAKAGVKTVDMETTTRSDRAFILRDVENKNRFSLIMPVKANSENSYKTITEFGKVDAKTAAPKSEKKPSEPVSTENAQVDFNESKDQRLAKELYLLTLKPYTEDARWQTTDEAKRTEIRTKLRDSAIKNSDKLVDDIERKDYERLSAILHKGNPTSRAAFSRITGIKLPDTVKGTDAVLKEFTGYVEPAVEKKVVMTSEERTAKMREAKDNSVLDTKVNYGNLGIMTRREFIDKLSKEGWKAEIDKVDDTALVKRTQDEFERMRKADVPIGNMNNPQTKRFFELRDMVRAFEKEMPTKDRLVISNDKSLYQITRAEYDYFERIKSEREPLTQKQIDNAEPLTTAKIQEAAKAAPKAGNTLKEQKDELLSELEGVRQVIIDTVVKNIGGERLTPEILAEDVTLRDSVVGQGKDYVDEIIQKLKDEGFTVNDRQQVISEIPGDGTFYTNIWNIQEFIDRVDKKFPTKEKPTEKNYTAGSGARDIPIKELTQSSYIGAFGSLENVKANYREAKKNYETASNSGNAKLKEVMKKGLDEAKAQLDAAENFDFDEYNKVLGELREQEKNFEEAKSAGFSFEENSSTNRSGFYGSRSSSWYDIKLNGKKIGVENTESEATDRIAQIYGLLKKYGETENKNPNIEALELADSIAKEGKTLEEKVKELNDEVNEAQEKQSPFMKKDGSGPRKLNKNDQRAFDYAERQMDEANKLLSKITADDKLIRKYLNQSPAEAPKADGKPSDLQQSLSKLENDDKYTIADLADDVEAFGPDHPKAVELKDALDKFRSEQEYDRSLSGRGDMDTASKEFENSVRSIIGGMKEAVETPSAKESFDFSKMTEKELLEKITSSKNDAELQALQSELKSRPSAEAKEPWQMTKDEFSKAVYSGEKDFARLGLSKRNIQQTVENYNNTKDIQNKEIAKQDIDKAIDQHHGAEVATAYAEGKDVPDNVLNDYPELKSLKAKKSETEKPIEQPKGERTPSFETYKDIRTKLKKGEYDAKTLKEDFQYYVDNKEAITKSIRDWLDTDPNYKRKRSSTKDEIAENTYKNTLEGFAYAGHDFIVTSGVDGDYAQKHFKAIKDQVAATTDEMIAKKKAEREKEEQKQQEYVGRVKQAIDNPQTLEDFKLRRQYKAPELSPEQQDRYEDLYAAYRKAKRAKDVIVEPTAVGEHNIRQDKDTRDNSDIWVVLPKERLSSEAFNKYSTAMRQAGGYYSRFKKGFIFKEDPSGKLGGTEAIDRTPKVHSDRLRETADNMQDTIDKKLDTGGTRLENTARRARMGDSQRADGEQMERIQQTMRNIADGLDGGDITLINKISARTEIEQLESILYQARHKNAREVSTKETNNFDQSKAYEKVKNAPITAETVRFAEFPKITLHKSEALKLVEALGASSTTGKQVSKLIRSTKDEYSVDITDIYQRVINAYERVKSDSYTKTALENAAKDVRRLEKLGIETTEELRAYLREYIKFRPERKTDTAGDELRKKERDLLGAKIEGYFPTPKPLVERMLDLADIQDGMTVTEPSAGKGNIADAIREEYPNAKLSVIEQFSTLRDILKLKNHNLTGNDFLQSTEKSDRFVMNPPFENMQDVDHVRHAYDLLNPGGKIVAIMSESPFFNSNKKAQGFRDWMETVGGVSEKNPEGSFKTSERPTGVATRIVTIEKQKEAVGEQPKAEPKPKSDTLNSFALGAVYLGTNQAIDALPIDDDRKKLLKQLLAAGALGAGMVLAPKWYLKSAKALAEAKQAVFNVGQARALFKDIKSEEMKWTGLDDFLKTKEAKNERITKEELQKHLEENNVEIKEVVKGEKIRSLDKLPSGYKVNDRGESYVTSPEYQQFRFYVTDENGRPISSGSSKAEAESNTLNFLNEETTSTKHSTWQLPGGENYRELLLTMPENNAARPRMKAEQLNADEYQVYFEDTNKFVGNPVGAKSFSEAVETAWNRYKKENPEKLGNFRSSHFEEPNILAHVRFNDRMVDGKKVLFMEEVQSDLHQKGRKDGYNDPKGRELYDIAKRYYHLRRSMYEGQYTKEAYAQKVTKLNEELKEIGKTAADAFALSEEYGDFTRPYQAKIPDMPFKKDWHEMAFRRMVRYAAENGYDGIAWTKGKDQIDRYNQALRQNVDRFDTAKIGDEVTVLASKDGVTTFNDTIPLNGTAHILGKDVSLDDVVGKEIADKIRSSAENNQVFEGEDLSIGGDGMRGFYDKMLPAYASKFGKKFGAGVGEIDIEVASKDKGRLRPKEISHEYDVDDYVTQGYSFYLKNSNGITEVPAETAKTLLRTKGGTVIAMRKSGSLAHFIPVTESMRKTVNENGMNLFSVASGVAYAGVDALPVDDDTKKKLKVLFGALTVAGLSVSMSKDAQKMLAELRAGIAKRALSSKWDESRIASETRRATADFLRSDEAKGFSASDIEAIKKANESPEFAAEAKKTSEVVRSVPEPKTPIERAIQTASNPALLESDRTLGKVERAVDDAKNYFENMVEIGKDAYKNKGTITKNFVRNIVRATTEASVNPDFKKIYDVVGDNERLSNARINDIDTQIREARVGLTETELDRVAKLRYKENKQEGIYTDSELSKMGYSEKEIISINKLRKAQSDVLDISRDLRLKEWHEYLDGLEEKAQAERWRETDAKPSKELAKIEKEITDTKETIRKVENYYQELKDQGYLTLKRRGRYVVVAQDMTKPEGDPNRLQYDHAISRNEQQNIKKRFERAGFTGIELYENKKFYSKFKEKLSPSELEILMEDAGVNPYSPEGTKILAEAKKKFATKSYELPRKYTPGYEESMDNLVRGLVNQGEAYNNLYFRKVGKEEAMRALQQTAIEHTKPDLYGFTREYIDASFSSPEQNWKKLHGAKKLTAILQLGLDPMQFVFNGVFQPLMVTRPYFSRPEFKLEGNEVNSYFKKGIDLAREAVKGEAEPELQGFYDRAVREGVATEVLSKEIADIEAKESGWIATMANKTSYFTRKGEQWTRSQTIAEAYLIGKEKLNLSGDKLYRFIVDAVAETQGKAGRGEMPDIFRRFGEPGRAAYQFGSYVNLYIENAALSIRSDVKSGKMSLPTFRKIVVTLGIVGGMNAFPGSGLAQALYVKLTGRDPEKDLKNNLGEIPAELLMYGITTSPSFSGRLGMWNRLPQQNNRDVVSNALINMIPALNQGNQLIEAGQNLYNGKVGKAAETFAPKGLRNVLKAIAMKRDGVKVNGGKETLIAPSNVSLMDVMKQSVGITPQKLNDYYRRKALGIKKSNY